MTMSSSCLVGRHDTCYSIDCLCSHHVIADIERDTLKRKTAEQWAARPCQLCGDPTNHRSIDSVVERLLIERDHTAPKPDALHLGQRCDAGRGC